MAGSCPKTPKCPLFNNKLLKRKESEETYKTLYCINEDRYPQCKRFIVAEKLGSCPDFVMPNSTLSIEDIENRMKNSGLLH